MFLIVALAILAAIGYNVYPDFRFLVLFTIGRSPVCPLSAALQVDENVARVVEYKDQILNASKLAQEDQGFELWDTPMGRYWIPKGSRYVLPFNLAEEKRKVYGSGSEGPHKGDVVLDCGASVGVTVHGELEAGAKLVVAIEPAPENLECLRRNYADEIASDRVILYPKGVWDKDDVLTLRVDPSNSAADSFVLQRPGAVEVEKIPLTTIDKLVAELKLDRVDYIKMDIEGAEPRALAGAHDTLVKWKPRLSIATYHHTDDAEVILRAVRAIRPDYRMQCGPCSEADNAIRPDVLYFN